MKSAYTSSIGSFHLLSIIASNLEIPPSLKFSEVMELISMRAFPILNSFSSRANFCASPYMTSDIALNLPVVSGVHGIVTSSVSLVFTPRYDMTSNKQSLIR